MEDSLSGNDASRLQRFKRPRPPGEDGYRACIGCAVCVLACPVWRQTNDVMLTVCGRARALQGGASPGDLKESVMACVLCGACGPVCPEGVDTVGMTLDLRMKLADKGVSPLADRPRPPGEDASRLQRLKRPRPPGEDVSDMASAVEAGIRPKPEQIERLRRTGAKELIIKEGLLHSFLRQWLPGVRVTGPGEELLRRPAVRKSLRPTDMYVIATRGYHSDFSRLVKVYDRLRRETGCATNLNLQRAAIPTGAVSLQARLGLNAIDTVEQARWILDGRSVERIVVEDMEDRKPFEQASQLPVVHISELAPEKE